MSRNLSSPVSNTSLPVDGKDYHFARYTVAGTAVNLLALAQAAFTKPIVHVEIEVVTDSTVRISLNGSPSDPATGKSITSSLPWSFRGKITSLTAIWTSGTTPADVEVECMTGE